MPIKTRSCSRLHQKLSEHYLAASPKHFSSWLPGRDHESCQESLRHTQGKAERVLPHDYEIEQGQNYEGVDCKPANKREKNLNTTSAHRSCFLVSFKNHDIFKLSQRPSETANRCPHSTDGDVKACLAEETPCQSY